MPAAILSGSVLSCHPRSNPPPRGGDVPSPSHSSPSPRPVGTRFTASPFFPQISGTWWNRSLPNPSPPSQPRTSWDETSQPPSRPSITSGEATSRRHTCPPLRNARHQFGTSPALPQPVIKTLKGFQTVAGGKAVRPPPPVPRPQNAQPPPLAEGVGGGDIPASRKPSVPMNRDAPRYRGDETSLTEGASPGRTEPVRTEAQSGHAPFCVLLRGLRAHGSYREARRLRCGAPSPGSMPYA